MNDEQRQLFALAQHLPARLTTEQVACLLNCQNYDIPVLIAARLLKPLGNPLPSARKYFAAAEIIRLMRDSTWLNRVTATLQKYWMGRNGKRRHARGDASQEEREPDFLADNGSNRRQRGAGNS